MGLLILSFVIKKKARKKIIIGFTLILTIIFTNGQLFVLAIHAWSKPYCSLPDTSRVFEIALVAGGSVGYSDDLNQMDYNEKADRITEAMRLYRLGRIKKLYFSGESAFNLKKGITHAPQFLAYMKDMGVNPKDIVLEQEARTTRENVINLRKLLSGQNRETPILLITSGWHMRRFLKGFEFAGLRLVPYAVDVPGIDPDPEWQDFLPSWNVAQDWQMLIHEIVGLLILSPPKLNFIKLIK